MSHAGYFPEEDWDEDMKAEVAAVTKALEAAGHVPGERSIMFAGCPGPGDDGVWQMFSSNDTRVECFRCGKALVHRMSWSSRSAPEDTEHWEVDLFQEAADSSCV